MTFRDTLLQLMVVKGWSVNDLARESGLSFATVRSYTSKKGKGGRLPTLGNALKIAAALGVSVEVFKDCSDIVKADKDSISE
jgi:transcriptional regulator with XRE-family HTH domain